MLNDGIAATVASHPDRLVGMGTIQLQAPELAVAEMERCVSELGLRGIEIISNVNGRELADNARRPFFAAAEEMDVLLFLNPLASLMGNACRIVIFDNIVGNPLESAIVLSRLIFNGVLDACPGQRRCVTHGIEYLPGYWGAWTMRFACGSTAASMSISRPHPSCAVSGSTCSCSTAISSTVSSPLTVQTSCARAQIIRSHGGTRPRSASTNS